MAITDIDPNNFDETFDTYYNSLPTGNIPGMTSPAINYKDSPVNFMRRQNNPALPFYKEPATNIKNIVQDFPGSVTSGIGNFKDTIGRGITSILDNTMLGRIVAMQNPLNPNAANYNPNLQGQIDFLNDLSVDGIRMIGRDPNTGLAKYGPDSILSGQNVMSGFGTNDYGQQLQKYYDKYADTMSPERLAKLEAEMAAFAEKEEEDYQTKIKDFVTNYKRTGVKKMFEEVYDGTNIHGGDKITGGTTPTGGGGDGTYGEGAGGQSYSDMGTQGFGVAAGGMGGPVSNRTGRGRQDYKHGGLASIL